MQLGDELNKMGKKLQAESETKLPDDGVSLELWFNEKLVKIIRPRDQSDRTSFRRIGIWLVREIREGRFEKDIFERVLRYAQEASGPDSRNPAAVFMSILKKELGYKR